MTIELVRGVRITCDRCGKDYGWSEFRTVREAVDQVRSDGWLVENRLATCPSCRRSS